MVMEERTSEPEQNSELVPQSVEATALAKTDGLAPPANVTAEEVEELKKRAAEVVQQLAEASGSKELALVDSITTVGVQAQRRAGGDLELLRARVGDMLHQDGPPGQVAQDLIGLRMTLNQINPHELRRSGVLGVLSHLPVLNRFQSVLKIVERIAIRYETVSNQVVVIEKRLRDGRLMLRRDNIELRKLFEQVESQQGPIQKNAYLGELLMQQLEELLAETEEARKRERLQSALYDVSMRVQDLRTMEEVHTHLFVSIEMTRQNNTRLGQAVDRTLTLATNTLLVGLAIQSALLRQKRVLEATQRMREFLGDLIVANAGLIKQHTSEIGDVYKEPVIALEKITQAHNDLIEAMDTADRLKTEGIEAARGNIVKLRELTATLVQRSGGITEQKEAASLEA